VTPADARRQFGGLFVVGLGLWLVKATYLGVRFGWTQATWRHADFSFSYALIGGTAVLWVFLRIVEATSKTR
jgi:hypothetical protein